MPIEIGISTTVGGIAGNTPGGTPAFTNTKSILLDGFDDYVDCGSISSINSASIVSISIWGKKASASGDDMTVGSLVSSTNGIWLQWYIDNTLYFTVRNGASMHTSYALSGDTNWHNIVGVYNGVNSKIYVDGSLVATGTNIPSSLSSTAGNNFQIGALDGGFFTSGNLDEVSIFNTELSQSDVTSIYNGGVPNDISSLSPLSWWRCGDGDTAPTLTDNGSGGNNGTMVFFNTFSTDVPTASSFTNTKSILLDGFDDYVDIGNPSNLTAITSISISAWFKTTDTVGGLVIVGSDDQIQGRRYILRTHNSSCIKLRFISFSSNGSFDDIIGTTNINDGQWHHVMAINNGTNLKIYIDGVLDNSNTNGNLINTTFATPNINIGRRSYSGSEGYFSGSIDEVAIWSSDQSANASAIGGTIPTDLSTYNPISWWRCGNGDTAPTLTDNGSGGNDGTMQSFNTFSTDVPT